MKQRTGVQTSGGSGFQSSIGTPYGDIIPVRVIKVFLNTVDDEGLIDKYGKFAALGGILFEPLTNPEPPDENGEFSMNPQNFSFALPLLSNFKQPPTINEIVYVISLPTNKIMTDEADVDTWYIRTMNMWNSVHHNALPNNFFSVGADDNNKNYEQTEAGFVRNPSDDSTEIDLGTTFVEKLDIKNLQLYQGDSTFEGRWGNTIRLGSTVKNSSPENPWSDTGENGDPITIIKNGQTDDDSDPWIPQVENINTDKSSIYLTSTQKIPIEGASVNYNSYDTPPTSLDLYEGEQVLINSGRLVFNSKSDSILLSSQNSINLNSNDTVNIDTGQLSVDAKLITLGNKDATESVILGDKFLDSYTKVIQKLVSLMNTLPTVGMPAPFRPNAGVITTSTQCLVQLQQHLTEIQSFKSKITYTK